MGKLKQKLIDKMLEDWIEFWLITLTIVFGLVPLVLILVVCAIYGIS